MSSIEIWYFGDPVHADLLNTWTLLPHKNSFRHLPSLLLSSFLQLLKFWYIYCIKSKKNKKHTCISSHTLTLCFDSPWTSSPSHCMSFICVFCPTSHPRCLGLWSNFLSCAKFPLGRPSLSGNYAAKWRERSQTPLGLIILTVTLL